MSAWDVRKGPVPLPALLTRDTAAAVGRGEEGAGR